MDEAGPPEAEKLRREALLTEYTVMADERRWLADIRFKLIAFLPAGAVLGAIGTLSSENLPGWWPILLALFGVWVTACLYVYHLRNDQLYGDLVGRLGEIEQELGLEEGTSARRMPTWQRLTPGPRVEHSWPISGVYLGSFAFWLVLGLVSALKPEGQVAWALLVFGVLFAVIVVALLVARSRRRAERAMRKVAASLLELVLADPIRGPALGLPEQVATQILEAAPHVVDRIQAELRRVGGEDAVVVRHQHVMDWLDSQLAALRGSDLTAAPMEDGMREVVARRRVRALLGFRRLTF